MSPKTPTIISDNDEECRSLYLSDLVIYCLPELDIKSSPELSFVNASSDVFESLSSSSTSSH